MRLHWRLFLWFFGTIVFAAIVSWLTVVLTRSPPQDRSHMFSQLVANRLASEWDDPALADAYLASIKPTLAVDIKLIRDPAPFLKPHPQPKSWTPWAPPHGPTYLPIVKNGQVVGGLTWDSPPGSQPPAWRFFIFPIIYTFIFSIAAWGIAKRLARPIETVAHAAERFGTGDMSARSQLAGEKRWMANEVAELASSFDHMAERIAGVVRDQRELLAAISHELRSPLGRARVALEIARDRSELSDVEGGPPPDPTLLPRTLARIETELGEVDAILGDLLAAARAGLSDLRTARIELAPWLRARIAAERTPPDVELVVDADFEASVDVALLGRAVHNLIENARAHGHPDDEPLTVHLALSRGAGAAKARIAVRDAGPGFPVDILDRAFEPFVRGGDQARTPKSPKTKDGMGGNTGLGLALVRRIAEAHGGFAFARNLERGAEVAIEIPATRIPTPPASGA